MIIKAFIVDDEPKSISILINKLERFCPNVQILGYTQNPLDAISMIKEMEPNLVFLDVSMPQINGFELLAQFENPEFEVIFATAYDQYAIEAINRSAIGYILKPYDNDELVKAVHRAVVHIEQYTTLARNSQLLENLQLSNSNISKIMIPNREGILFVNIEDVIHCEGVEGYTQIYLKNKKTILSSQSIGNFLKLLPESTFFHCHKSHIINLNYIQKYLNEGYLIMESDIKVPFSKHKKEDFFDRIERLQSNL